jgi:hypothetical protein
VKRLAMAMLALASCTPHHADPPPPHVVGATGNFAFPIGPAAVNGLDAGTYPGLTLPQCGAGLVWGAGGPGTDGGCVAVDAGGGGTTLEAGSNFQTLQTVDGAVKFAAPSPQAWNALTFGCDPTGAVTSTACLNAMLSMQAASGGQVYLPATASGSTYVIDAMLSITTVGAEIISDPGVVLQVKSGSGLRAAIDVLAVNVHIKNLTIDGNQSAIDDVVFQGAAGFVGDYLLARNALASGYHATSATSTTIGAVTQTSGSATTPPTISGQLQIGEVVAPWFPYELNIVGSGGLGTATVRFSDNNSVNWSATYTIQSNGIIQLPFVETASNNPAAPSWSGLTAVFPSATYASGQNFQWTPSVGGIADNSNVKLDHSSGTNNGGLYHTTGMPVFWGGFAGTLVTTPGTITVASANVVGVGTTFLATNARPGDWLTYEAAGAWWPVQIVCVIDDTHLTVTNPPTYTGGGSGLDFAISAGSGYYGEIFVEYSAGDIISGGLWAQNGGVGLKLDGREGIEVVSPYTSFNGAGGYSVGVALGGAKPIGMNIRGLESDQDALFGGALQQGQNALIQTKMISAGIEQGPQYTSFSGGVYGQIQGLYTYNDTTGSATIYNGGGAETVTSYLASTIVLPRMTAYATYDNTGSESVRKTQLGLSAGSNGNLSTHGRSEVEFVPAAAGATVAGISFDGTAVAEIGQVIHWQNTSLVYPVTFLNISGSSLGTNAFHTATNIDWNAPPGASGTFRYLDALIGGTGGGWWVETSTPDFYDDANGNPHAGSATSTLIVNGIGVACATGCGYGPTTGSVAIAGSGTTTLTTLQAANPGIHLTGTLTAAATVKWPALSGTGAAGGYWVDISGVSGIGVTNTLTFAYGSGTCNAIVAAGSGPTNFWLVWTNVSGSNSILCR